MGIRYFEENFLLTFRLKPGVEFHLFITTSPCGDARIFSLHENPSPSAAAAKEKKAAADAASSSDAAVLLPPKLFDIEGAVAEQSNEGDDSDYRRAIFLFSSATSFLEILVPIIDLG